MDFGLPQNDPVRANLAKAMARLDRLDERIKEVEDAL
jgi:hypothetical protein